MSAYGSRKKKTATLKKNNKFTYPVCAGSVYFFPQEPRNCITFYQKKKVHVCIYVHGNRTFFFMANAFQFQSTKSPVASLSLGTSKAKLKGAGRGKEHNR